VSIGHALTVDALTMGLEKTIAAYLKALQLWEIAGNKKGALSAFFIGWNATERQGYLASHPTNWMKHYYHSHHK
jgi:hypothetical protein